MKIQLNQEETDELISMLDTSTDALYDIVRMAGIPDHQKQEAERRLDLQMDLMKRLTSPHN